MKSSTNIVLIIFVPLLFATCTSTQKLQQKAPMEFGTTYCRKWISGVKGGGSGLNLFIPITTGSSENSRLDSVYFRRKAVKLELIKGEALVYVGRFESEFNQKPDIVMSDDPKEEYGNKVPGILPKIHFDLKDSECVVSYKTGEVTTYFKIENVIEKQPEHYPRVNTDKH